MTTAPTAVSAPYGSRLRRLLARLRANNVAYPLGYMAGLDGARGLMTLGVLVAHTSRMSFFQGALVYMDVFFTMSGYLITSLLLKDYDKHGSISVKKFYVRRVMRLYPALTAMVLAVLLMSWMFSPNFGDRLTEALLSWFYLMDYAFLWDDGRRAVKYTDHTWSLAVEEQFYLIWPLVFGGMLALWGVSKRTVAGIFALAAMFWAWRIFLTATGASITHLYGAFDTRADSLLIGCGLAVLLKIVDLRAYPRLWRLIPHTLLPLAVAMIVVGLVVPWAARWYFYVSPLLGALPAAISIVALNHPDRGFMHRIYEHPVPVFLGRICYGLYIWHYPVFMMIVHSGYTRYSTTVLIGWPLTFALAIASYYLLERPFMRKRAAI